MIMDFRRRLDKEVKYISGLTRWSFVNRICILMVKMVPRSQPEVNRTGAWVKEGWTELDDDDDDDDDDKR
jgi:hypothetical protein